MKRWAWDFFPLAEACFLFLLGGGDRNAPKAGEWMLELRVRVDSGHEGYDGEGEVDPACFGPAEACTSSLWLFMWLCDGGCPRTGPTGSGSAVHDRKSTGRRYRTRKVRFASSGTGSISRPYRIGRELVRNGLKVTIADPVGLYIGELDLAPIERRGGVAAWRPPIAGRSCEAAKPTD